MTANDQERIKTLLDEHFVPLLNEEWRNDLSVYEIGCKPTDGKMNQVIVWMRSSNLPKHVKGLMETDGPMMTLDTDTRGVDDKDGPDTSCKLREDTVIVRLLKKITSKTEGPTDLMVELFQVYKDETDAKEAFEFILEMVSPTESAS